MIAFIGTLVFTAAFLAVLGVFAFTLVPALPRIVAILRGRTDPALISGQMLVVSDRRLRVRVRPVLATARLARPQAQRVAA